MCALLYSDKIIAPLKFYLIFYLKGDIISKYSAKLCLYVLLCSNMDNSVLVAQGVLSQCTAVLITLGGTVAKGNREDGLELVSFCKATSSSHTTHILSI